MTARNLGIILFMAVVGFYATSWLVHTLGS